MTNFVFAFIFPLSIFAASNFECTTKSKEDSYIKSKMEVTVKSPRSIFVRPFDAFTSEWNEGSTGQFNSVKPDGTVVFKDFSSEGMFGDLSEGSADGGIYIYISSAVMKGQNGILTLVARGTEVGLQKAVYSCRLR